MIFAQMLEIVALSDLALVLCARKFFFDPQGGFTRRRETSALCACFGLKSELDFDIYHSFFEKTILYMPGKF